MTWLTSAWAFYGSLAVLLVLLNFAVAIFAPDPTTGKTLLRQLRDDYQRQSDETLLKFPDFRGKLERLLKSGYDRSSLRATFDDSGLFIQFRKYVHAKGDYGIELEFPLAPWSAKFVPALHDICSAQNVAFTIGPDVYDNSEEFHHVDFGKDSDAAFRMTEAIVTNAFQISIDSPYSLRFSGIDPFGVAITDPRQVPPSRAELLERENETLAHQVVYVFDASLVSLGGKSNYFGILGILYSLFWNMLWAVEGLTPNWGAVAVSLHNVTINPRIFELVCFGMMFIALLIDRSPSARRLKAEQSRASAKPSRRSRVADSIFPRHARVPALIAATILFWIA